LRRGRVSPGDREADVGVGHSGGSGEPKAVSGQVGYAEIADDLVLVCRVANVRRRERAAFGPTRSLSSGFSPFVRRSRIGTRRSLRSTIYPGEADPGIARETGPLRTSAHLDASLAADTINL